MNKTAVLTNIKLGGVKFNNSSRPTTYKSKRTTVQLLALAFAFFVPSLLLSCANHIPGHDDENLDTRTPQDTTPQDTTTGFTDSISPWGNSVTIETEAIPVNDSNCKMEYRP